jgi:hypothetical protein
MQRSTKIKIRSQPHLPNHPILHLQRRQLFFRLEYPSPNPDSYALNTSTWIAKFIEEVLAIKQPIISI